MLFASDHFHQIKHALPRILCILGGIRDQPLDGLFLGSEVPAEPSASPALALRVLPESRILVAPCLILTSLILFDELVSLFSNTLFVGNG